MGSKKEQESFCMPTEMSLRYGKPQIVENSYVMHSMFKGTIREWKQAWPRTIGKERWRGKKRELQRRKACQFYCHQKRIINSFELV